MRRKLMLSLKLNVQDHKCICGNQWTHSYATFMAGGTPSPQEEHKLPLTHLYTAPTRHHNHCHRCVNLALGVGWTRPQSTRPQSLLAELAELVNINVI